MTAPLALGRGRLGAGLLLAVGLVALLGLASETAENGLQWERAGPWVDALSLSEEGNLPTWFSSGLLLTCGLLLLLAGAAARRQGAPDVLRWRLLGATFLYLSLDEAVPIHERMNAWFDGSGVLHYGWVLPAAALVSALALAYLPFLRRLERTTRRRFLVAGAVYVGGALAMELPLGWWMDRHGSQNMGWVLIDFVEETAEMLGASLFLLALVDHLLGPAGRLVIERSARDGDTRPEPADAAREPAPRRTGAGGERTLRPPGLPVGHG